MTFKEVVLGLAIAVVVGVGFAVALHLNDTLRRAFYPLIVASQTIPIVAIAPVLVLWLGYGIGPSSSSSRSSASSRSRWRPRRPPRGGPRRDPDDAHAPCEPGHSPAAPRASSALPQFFSGARVAVAIAAIGAVLGELVVPTRDSGT